MTDQCPACTATSRDSLLCGRCSHRLEVALGELPALLRELDVTISRQDRSGAPLYAMRKDREQIPGVHYDEGDTTLPSTPWPFAWDAANVRWNVLNTLGVWAGEVGRRLDLNALDACRRHPLAGRLLDEVLFARDSINAAVDNPEPDVFLGRCTASNVTVTDVDGQLHPEVSACGADLLGRTGDESVRCRRCSTVYDVAGRNDELLEQANDAWAPAQAIADALTTRDEPVNASTLRTWIDRDKRAKAAGRLVDYPLILQVGTSVDGRTALYRVGDVRDRIAYARARRGVRVAS